jgi:hypothetical protein
MSYSKLYCVMPLLLNEGTFKTPGLNGNATTKAGNLAQAEQAASLLGNVERAVATMQ